MLHRSKSKDRSFTGPTSMNKEQVASYLKDLRSYKSPRPFGARPPPASRRTAAVTSTLSPDQPIIEEDGKNHDDRPSRSASALSHTRTQSAATDALSPRTGPGRPLVLTPTRSESPAPTTDRTDSAAPASYMEGGRRWMERQEAHSLRRALEDMELAEEKRVHKAAQSEASELVWKHQNPESASAPYRYRDHLRKGSYARNHTGGARSSGATVPVFATKRTVSGSTTGRKSSLPRNREPSASMLQAGEAGDSLKNGSPVKQEEGVKDGHSKVKFAASIFSGRRRSSDGARKASGDGTKCVFANPNDKIFEEPAEMEPKMATETAAIKPSPMPSRRNPFARVHLARANVPPASSNTAPLPETKRFDKIEIQRNAPSQSRNAAYTSNKPLGEPPYNFIPPLDFEGAEVKMKDGKEVRGDDMRAATSMKLADRSAKLPTPVLVSDSPSRPIVSFKEPQTIELREEKAREFPTPPRKAVEAKFSTRRESAPAAPHAGSGHVRQAGSISSISRPSIDSKRASAITLINVADSPTVRDIQISAAPSIPSITVNGAPAINTNPIVPTISIGVSPPIPSVVIDAPPAIPSISVDAPSNCTPTISINGTSSTAPTVAVNSQPPNPLPTRPLPTPTKRTAGSAAPARPRPAAPTQHQQQTKHLSFTGAPRSTAVCTLCRQPIAGRIVSAAGARFHPQCFACHHCGEPLECVAFYPEPEAARSERLAARGGAEDGCDDAVAAVRFYCHLDFHELFSPRCRSCKTPIEGEVVLACGGTWHAGHFFCAQCGDAFQAGTPFVEKEGYAWCVGCHTNRFSSKCRRCRKPIVETVVKALGAEWCVGCFVCGECGGGFEGGRYFIREGGGGKGGNVVCSRCEERRLKA